MDKTNVMIKIPETLYENENFLNVNESQLVEKTIELLQNRKHIVNVLFKSDKETNPNKTATLTKIEILLADETGSFNYYEH